MDAHFVPIDRVTFFGYGKKLSRHLPPDNRLFFFVFLPPPHTSINGWGGELKWHLIPLTRSHYSGKASWTRVNCSFSDPVCTKNVVKSLILLTVPPRVAALISSADQCTFSRPSLQNKSTFFGVRGSSHWFPRMWDGVQKQLSKKLRRADRFPLAVLLAARAGRGPCLRSFVCSGWVFNQRWSMEVKRMQVFLSLCKLDRLDSVSTSPRFICELVFVEGKTRCVCECVWCWQRIPISRHTGRPLKYSTYTSSIDGESRWAPRCSSDERQAFENRGESVYSCLEEKKKKGLHINASRGHQFIYLSC